MSHEPQTSNVSETERLRLLRSRTVAGLLALGLATLLVVAGMLTPSKHGLGTHQQLGLPPCTVRVMYGIPCPSCGMTTSWSHFMRGSWRSSIQANSGGFALALLTLVVIVQSARVALSNAKITSTQLNLLAGALISVMVITAIDWILRIT